MRRTNAIIFFVLSIVITLIASGCPREKQEAINVEKICQEEVAPIRVMERVMEIAPRNFETILTFHASLTGLQESTAYASIVGKVEKILIKVGEPVKKEQSLVTFPADNPSARSIPRQNLIKENNPFILFLEKSGKALRREVTPGAPNSPDVEVLSGLQPGDRCNSRYDLTVHLRPPRRSR